MSLFLSAGSNLSQKPKIKEMKEEVAEKVSGTGLCFLLSRNKGPTSCSSSHLYSFHVVQLLVLKRCECWLNLKPHWLTAVRNAFFGTRISSFILTGEKNKKHSRKIYQLNYGGNVSGLLVHICTVLFETVWRVWGRWTVLPNMVVVGSLSLTVDH